MCSIMSIATGSQFNIKISSSLNLETTSFTMIRILLGIGFPYSRTKETISSNRLMVSKMSYSIRIIRKIINVLKLKKKSTIMRMTGDPVMMIATMVEITDLIQEIMISKIKGPMAIEVRDNMVNMKIVLLIS